MSEHSIDREIFSKFLAKPCPSGCMRKIGHDGFHTTNAEVAKREDEKNEQDGRSGELQ